MNIKQQHLLSLVGYSLVLLATSACSTQETKEDVRPDPAASTTPTDLSDARQENPVAGWSCPAGTSGSPMVLIERPDEGAYCIDARLTTYAQYQDFLDAKGDDVSGQPTACEPLNKSFLPPAEGDNACSEWLIDTEPERPVNCVDVCDAWSYCHWAGKRLCSIAGANPNQLTRLGDEEVVAVGQSTKSEWFNACSQGGTTKYPYGDTYEPAVCIDAAKVEAVGRDEALRATGAAESTCRGTEDPYDMIFEMGGPFRQWVNLCRTSGCATQGGDYMEEDPERLGCAESLGVNAMPAISHYRGIRCCADAVAAVP